MEDVTVAAGALLERDVELHRLGRALQAAVGGTGAALVVEGPAGIGKTGLIAVAVEMARAAGMECGRAVGGPLERDLPFGATRQLLGPLVRRGDDVAGLFGGVAAPVAELLGVRLESAPAADGLADAGVMLHGLYWLIANLADRCPLLLVADDAHWFDAPSLRLLAYLARRVVDLPVVLLVATRPAEPGAAGELLTALLGDQAVELVRPQPLSPTGVAAMVRGRLGVDAADDFCMACAQATGGNPFLTLSLVDALAEAGVAPTAAATSAVLDIGAAGAGRAVLRRLHALPADGLAVARAVAMLGADASPRHVADLTGLDSGRLADSVESLLRAGLLLDDRPLRLAHPLVRAAVHDELPPTRRSQMQVRAARLLADAGADAERVAAHLLATDPAGDPWVVSVLLDAAAAASRRGAPAAAVTLLNRAMAEPPTAQQRVDVLTALGKAESMIGAPTASDHLRSAMALVTDRAERISIAFALRRALVIVGRSDEAVEALVELLADLDDEPEAALLVEAAIAQTGFTAANAARPAARYVQRLRDRVAAGPDELPVDVRAIGSMAAVTANGPAGELGELAAKAIAEWRATNPDDVPVWMSFPLCTLVVCDHPDAAAATGWVLDVATGHGDLFMISIGLTTRCWLALRAGALATAEADARTAIEALELCGSAAYLAGPVGMLCEVLVERGELSAADELLVAHEFGGALDPHSEETVHVALGRARLRIAQNRIVDAAADLRELGDRCLTLSITTPAWAPWRAELSDALARLGRADEAAEIAAQDLALARQFGTSRTIGAAQRGLAMAMAGAAPDEAEANLVEAVETLDGSPAPLELIRAMIALGVLRRRRNARATARDILAKAMDVAARCGATALAERARTELVAAGGKPRRQRLTGKGALTPTELRVATLAAAGHTNREVAQSMFLTVKTVETHLARCYAKLMISGRPQLAAALASAKPAS